MPYLTTSDLVPYVAQQWLTEALDDDADGTADVGTEVIAAAGTKIDARLGPVYGAPIDVSDAQLAATLRDIGIGLALQILFIRRQVEPQKTVLDLIADAYKQLDLLATRKHPLSPTKAPIAPPISVIGEDNPAYPGAGHIAAVLALLLCCSALWHSSFCIRHSSFVMNASTLLQSVEDYLSPLLTPEKITLSVAETEEDVLEQLATSPTEARCILSLDGAKPVEGDLNLAGLVESRLVAWFQAPKGMAASKGKNIHRARTDGTPSFCTRLDGIIRKLRAMQIIHAEVHCANWEFKGWDWLKFDGMAAWRTARAEFTLQHALDDPADVEATAPVILPSAFRITGAAAEFYTIALAGTAHGRVPRFEPAEGDPSGTATGYAITSAAAEFYTIAFDGAPHGRIPRFTAA